MPDRQRLRLKPKPPYLQVQVPKPAVKLFLLLPPALPNHLVQRHPDELPHVVLKQRVLRRQLLRYNNRPKRKPLPPKPLVRHLGVRRRGRKVSVTPADF